MIKTNNERTLSLGGEGNETDHKKMAYNGNDRRISADRVQRAGRNECGRSRYHGIS